MVIEELTSTAFEEGLQKTRTVLLPIGATEGHGQHLPLGTDTFQAQDVCRLAAERRPLFVAPALAYGVCRSTANHPGTLSISTNTLKALIIDIVNAFYRQGLRNVVILSGHAGGTHNAALLDAGESLLETFPELKVAVATEYDLAYEEGRGLIETEGDSHAGEIETSRMLATRPELVGDLPGKDAPDFPKHILVRDKVRYWPSAVWGDPGKATAKKGHQLEALVVDALLRLVDTMEKGQDDERA